MKRTLFSLILIFLTIGVSAQHVLYLKSGETIKGRLLGGGRDSVSFQFLGNDLRLPVDGLQAIWFDESSAPKALADPASGRDAKIHGYVTDSYFTSNETKADAGAKVWIVAEKDVENFNIKLVEDTFALVNNLKDIYNQFDSRNADVPQNILSTMVIYNVDTDAKFEDYCRRTNQNVFKLRNNKNAIHSTCDADGRFIVPVNSGTYYVLVISKQTKGESVVEQDGKMFCKKITIKPDEDYVLSVKFEVP